MCSKRLITNWRKKQRRKNGETSTECTQTKAARNKNHHLSILHAQKETIILVEQIEIGKEQLQRTGRWRKKSEAQLRQCIQELIRFSCRKHQKFCILLAEKKKYTSPSCSLICLIFCSFNYVFFHLLRFFFARFFSPPPFFL